MNPSEVRERLLGRAGPYADVREATDALDNVKLWISTLGTDEKRDAASALLSLAADDQIEVATGAILSLDLLKDHLDVDRLIRLFRDAENSLRRKPLGFAAITFGTLGEELFARLSAACGHDRSRELESILLQPVWREQASMLLGMLAARHPEVVLYHARQFLTHHDSPILLRLPSQWERIAVATALRPWSEASIEKLLSLAKWKKLPPLDLEALVRVMRDDYPALTRPGGLGDDRIWWIIGGSPHECTIWETTDGTLAIETFLPGPGYTSRARVLNFAESHAFRTSRQLPSAHLPK